MVLLPLGNGLIRELSHRVAHHSCQRNDAFCRLHLRYAEPYHDYLSGHAPAAIKANTGANRVGPKDKVKTLYVPRGCVDAYKTAWKVLLDEGNWEVKEIVK